MRFDNIPTGFNEIPEGFNWLTELTKLSHDDGEISRWEHNELIRMAGNWPTCACGQLCALLPRDHQRAPLDHSLRLWGVKFAEYVQAKKWCLALQTFEKIEDRTKVLLEKEMISPSSRPR